MRKKGSYAKDCYSLTINEKRLEELSKKVKQAQRRKNQAKATRSMIDYDDSDVELYLARQAFISHITDKKELNV